MWELIERAGIMIYPLALSSLLGLTIIIERLLTLRRKNIIIPEVVDVVEQFNSFNDMELARKICARHQGPLPNIVMTSLENSDLGKEELKELLEDEGRQEVSRLEKGLGVLETVAAVAPLLGLLGTVLGMIKVFGVIKDQGVGQAAALSGGISEALLTTVIGLFIGIPALVCYNYFSHKAEKFTLEIEKHSNDLFRKINRLKATGSVTGQMVEAGDVKFK
jgi:biopolymer transport protein ExbB